MPPGTVLGEFEHLVMLAVMQLDGEATAIGIRSLLEERADRSVARGALYATLERLERKGYVSWRTESSTPARGGIPRRLFVAKPAGVSAVERSSRAIARLSEGLSLP